MLHRLDLYLLPQLSEIRSAECDCRSRKTVCEHIAALIERYARSLDHEPLTLLLLGGCAAGDFFAILDFFNCSTSVRVPRLGASRSHPVLVNPTASVRFST
jgi:uncharacterized Zn finger protein